MVRVEALAVAHSLPLEEFLRKGGVSAKEDVSPQRRQLGSGAAAAAPGS